MIDNLTVNLNFISTVYLNNTGFMPSRSSLYEMRFSGLLNIQQFI